MTDPNNDFKLGDPSQIATGKAKNGEAPKATTLEKPSTRSSHREGEVIVAIPEPENINSRPLNREEQKKYKQHDEEADQKRLDSLATQLLNDSGGWQIPAGLRSALMWSLIVVAAVLMLLVVGQVTSTLAQLKTLPAWSQWVVSTLLLLISGIILFVVIKLVMVFLKLKKAEQINFAALQRLHERAVLRNLSKQHTEEAVTKLKSYLHDFPIDSATQFIGFGFSLEEYADLMKVRTKLLDNSKIDSNERWLKYFKANFQYPLDQIAVAHSKEYAKKAALKTAISPLPLLDNAIILTLSLSMVRDLMVLYNLRMSIAGASQILIRSIGQAYIAGEIQDISETLFESLGDMIGEQTGQFTAKGGKILGSKAGEGLANGILLYRLGKATSKLLQPTN